VSGSAPHPALLIDDAAVGTDQDKKFVLVVDQSDRVAYREISLGAMQGNLRVVKGGLKAGDRIVVNGTQRVRPGDTVHAHAVPMNGDDDQDSASVAQTQARAKTQKNS
jgi:multidrug efflux system membrane fusion protein